VARQVRLPSGELLLVGVDVEDQRGYVLRVARASWGAGALVLVLGLAVAWSSAATPAATWRD
jgi:hypothetical protein